MKTQMTSFEEEERRGPLSSNIRSARTLLFSK